jgi:hypothetical protein
VGFVVVQPRAIRTTALVATRIATAGRSNAGTEQQSHDTRERRILRHWSARTGAVFLRSSDRRLDLAFTGELAIDDSGNWLPGYDRVEMPSEALPLDRIGVPAERIHDRRWRLWAHWHVQPAGNPPFSTIAISMTSSMESSLPTLPLATGTFASNP